MSAQAALGGINGQIPDSEFKRQLTQRAHKIARVHRYQARQEIVIEKDPQREQVEKKKRDRARVSNLRALIV